MYEFINKHQNKIALISSLIVVIMGLTPFIHYFITKA